MCGIFCSVSKNQHLHPSDKVRQFLEARGPDASNEVLIPISASTPPRTFLTLYSTVLSLRGDNPTEQPYRSHSSESYLCWNGEAWTVERKSPNGNDTARIYGLLESALAGTRPSTEVDSAVLISRAMSTVAGPYAFVFYHGETSKVYFGRDLLGRRSLLYRVTDAGDFLLSSITDGSQHENWTEVEADGIYCLDLASPQPPDVEGCMILGAFPAHQVPYTFALAQTSNSTSVIPQLSLNRQIPPTHLPLHETSYPVQLLEQHLRISLSERITNIPDPPQRVDDLSGLRVSRLAVLFSGGLDCTVLARLAHDIFPSPSEPFDLLNVAFENPRVHRDAGERAFELCPDRITGRASFRELCDVCPEREWRFVTINVSYKDFCEHRQQIITLMHPHNTEMDLSIAAALYFAARGNGTGESSKTDGDLPYTTSARVLLSGLGADELFAGYTRHVTAYNRKGFDGLLDEIELDVARLGKRNLGRDDRVITHWGREARFPFLAESLVNWALTTPVTDKCDFGALDVEAADPNSCLSIEHGKKVLRCLAWKLGMKSVAREKKRAIQFGARTAKMETGKTKGTTLLS